MRLIMLLLLLLTVAVIIHRVARAIETPNHTVESKAEGYEVRVYAPFIVAEVTVENDRGRAMNEGFRQLADFIFGNNREATEISMTAPVIERAAGSDIVADSDPSTGESDAEQDSRRIVSFVMPRKFTLENLPTPENENIVIRKVAGGRYAVLTFDGYAEADSVAKRSKELRGYLERDSVTPAGGALVAQYNPPWTPPKTRRNEILFPLQSAPQPAESVEAP